ncbi:hypothetical protein [Neobacillus cucumis]|nr:hypothetical protein [Neobacillus cucumis]
MKSTSVTESSLKESHKQEENEMRFIGDKESLNSDFQDLFLAYEEENR